MGIISDIFYFVIAIGILVLIHELGHFLAAKATGMRTDIFSIGMGYRLIGYNKRSGITFGKLPDNFEFDGLTDYRLAVFPIGGYVKIVGMVDESMDKEVINQPAQPWEFRSKNAFQKTFVLAAGVIMNFLLAVAVFASIVYFNGEESYQTTQVGYVKNASLADKIGLKTGDRIKSVGGVATNSWNDIIEFLTTKDFGSNRDLIVIRDGGELTLKAQGEQIIRAMIDTKQLGFEPIGMKTLIMDVIANKAAAQTALKGGDTIKTVNGENVDSMTEFVDLLKSHKSQTVAISWSHNGQIVSDSVRTDERGTIGVQISQAFVGKTIMLNYGFFQSLGYGYEQTVSSVKLLFNSIGQMFKGTISFKESVGGPIMIAKQASQQAERGILNFLGFVGLLSVSLAVLNILPFPALDGGHIVFVIIEAIIRKEVPIKIKMAIQQTGMIVLLLFMAFVVYNDIIR